MGSKGRSAFSELTGILRQGSVAASWPVRVALAALAAICAAQPAFSQAAGPTLEELRGIGLPVLDIKTVDGEAPTCEYVSEPGGGGKAIKNATKVPASMDIWLDGAKVYDSGEYEKGESGLTIKIRGNTSAYYAKKPYKLKMQKKADLLGLGDARYKNKDWVLLCSGPMTLSQIIGFKVSELCGLQWTPRLRPVNVVLNGTYQGLYILAEAVSRDEARLNVDKATGYIFEADPYWWNEEYYVEGPGFEKFTFKYPDYKDLTDGQRTYFKKMINEVCLSLDNGEYDKYIDVNSFAAWTLAHDILGISDGAGSNKYFTKYDNTPNSKVMAANIWDTDPIMDTPGKWAAYRSNGLFCYYKLFYSSNKTFNRAYVEKYLRIRERVFGGVAALLDSLETSEGGKALDVSWQYDDRKWNQTTTLAGEIARARKWFPERREWLDGEVPALAPEIAARIETAAMPAAKADSLAEYNVLGQRVGRDYKGIVIRGGRKFLRQ